MGNKISVSVPNFNLPRRRRNDRTNYYMIKVNDVQIDRIQQMHHILKTCCEGNFYSPISRDLSRGIKVLDVGSGPGTWIFDMSSEYPNSEFIGIEVQEFMLPTIYPSNTRFVHNNVLEGIPFSPNSFDYIHMRCMTLCFTEQQYEQILSDLLVLLKPNGYLELCEIQLCSTNMGPYSEILSTETGKLLKSKSLNPFMNEQLGELLNHFGLQGIDQQEVEIPMCELDGKIAAVYGETLFNAVVGLKDALMKQMKISKVAMDTLLNDYHHELKTRRMYSKYTRVYGRKSIKQQ